MSNLKVRIRLEHDARGNFWVRKSGVHHAFATEREAMAYARDLQAAAGGFPRAVIVNRVGEAQP